MFKISPAEQGSPQWFQDRLGKWTASFFAKAMTSTGKRSASADEIVNRLVAEKILGEPDETFISDAMIRGQELEFEALEFVNFALGMNFERCGFIEAVNENGDSLGFGASADALDKELMIGLEMKCPLPHTHLSYLANGGLPEKYKAQVQGGMMVTGYSKWVFVSYHPTIKPLIVVVDRDEAYIRNLRSIVTSVCKEVKEKVEILTNELEESA